jgi:uncharacterized protein YggE
VTVWGEALVRTAPDEAVLWLTLSALEDAPGAALSDVAARGDALVALLDGLGVTKADRSTTGITHRAPRDLADGGAPDRSGTGRAARLHGGRRALGTRSRAALTDLA